MELHATFETERGSQYLQTLCKHFGRKVSVRFDANVGVIELPFGQCELKASATRLELSISADCQSDLERAAQVISNHLDRYAFRENPELTWQLAAEAAAAEQTAI